MVTIRQRIERIIEFVEDTERIFRKRQKTLNEMLKKLRQDIAARGRKDDAR